MLGLSFWLRPATPGWGVGVCVCLCACSACTLPLLAGVCGVGVCAWARVSAAPHHSWLGSWGVCVLVYVLRLYPATPGSGVRRGCVCLGSLFGCAPPVLAGVLGCVCACVRAPLVPCRSWLGCAVLVCVLGLGFRLRPTTPGWGLGVCVSLCACSACTPPLLALVCGVGVCAWAQVSAAPRLSWLEGGGVCVHVCVLRFYPAASGLGVSHWSVCLGSGFGCAPPLFVGVLGCVCVRVRAPLVPRHPWLGCAALVCVLGLGSQLRPTTPGWGLGMCVCLCACSACTPPLLARVCVVGGCVWAPASAAARHSWLGCCGVCLSAPLVSRHSWLGCAVWVCVPGLGFPLRPATPSCGVGVCLRSCARSARSPPLLVGVYGAAVCAWAQTSAVPRHSWLGCWCVCAFVCALPLYPATPGPGVRCGCVCLGWGFGCAPATPGSGVVVCVCLCVYFACTPPLLAGVCGVWVRCCQAPVAWLVACCARCPCLLLLGTCPCALVVAGGVPLWGASWPRVGAPRLVRSSRCQWSGRLFRRRGAFLHPGGLRTWIYWAAARGTGRPVESRALCACRWPPPRRGPPARSASYLFGASRWACPWWVPPASVVGCVRCRGLRVRTRSLTRLVSHTASLPTGDSAGAPRLFPVDADTAPFGSEDATPGWRACVPVPLGRVGRAGLPGAFWCAFPLPMAGLGAFAVYSAPSGLGLPYFALCLPALRVGAPGSHKRWRAFNCVPHTLILYGQCGLPFKVEA